MPPTTAVRSAHRRATVRAAAVVVALFVLVTGIVVGGCASGPPPIRHSSDTVVASTPVGTATAEPNVFHPEDRDLSECRPAVERPGCGSTAKGGWRMTLVFALLILGISVIIARIVVAARARSRVVNHPIGDWN